MKVKLTRREFDALRSAAKDFWLERHNIALEPSDYNLYCTLNAFAAHLSRLGVHIEIEVPVNEPYEPIDDL